MGNKQMQQADFDVEEKEYHQRDGWCFRRMNDGAVRIRHGIVSHVVPADEWASIVAAMSAHGENGTTYRAALEFHGN